MTNLFQISSEITLLSNEIFETIVSTKNVKIERIISFGQTSPDGFWYDQNEHEWVLLLKGYAKLEFEGNKVVELKPGDFINIPAHQKHRVAYTSTFEETIWLAVFYY